MKRYILLAIGLVAVGAWISDDLLARGGRGGGGFSGGGGGGGGRWRRRRRRTLVEVAVVAPAAEISLVTRRRCPDPSGGSRPSFERPSGGRQSFGKLPTPGGSNVARPGGGNVSRPGGGNISRPGGGERPDVGDLANRPVAANQSSRAVAIRRAISSTTS